MKNNRPFVILGRYKKHFRIVDREQYSKGYIAQQAWLDYDFDYNRKWTIHFDGNGYFVECKTFKDAINYLTKHYNRENKGFFI